MPSFLISRLSALGDVICTLPVASSLKAAFPDARITWAVDPRSAGIVDCADDVDEVVRTKPGLSPSTWPAYAERFDAILEMQGLLKSALATVKAKGKKRVGYHWQREFSSLFSQRVLPDTTSHHIVDQYVDVARAVGGGEEAAFRLTPKEEDLNKCSALLGSAKVLINPGAAWATKRWPPEHIAALMRMLDGEGIGCALIGAPDEKESHEEILKNAPGHTLAGQTSVRELVALTSLAKAHIGGDTGTTHLAAALGIPAIGLYSITNPRRSCPYGQIDRCHYNSAGLNQIEPEAVYRTVMEALS